MVLESAGDGDRGEGVGGWSCVYFCVCSGVEGFGAGGLATVTSQQQNYYLLSSYLMAALVFQKDSGGAGLIWGLFD